MKKLNSIILLISTLLLCAAFFAGDEKVHFYENDYATAVKEAKQQDKVVFIMFTADYCGVCHKMDKEVFTNSKVGKFFNNNFVNLKLDPSSGTMENMRASNYGVKKLPTFIYLDENKKVLLKSSGFKSGDDIIREAQTALNKKKKRRR